MSVSGTEYLSALDAILYNRPAGRNIIDFARETIERLRKENAELETAHNVRLDELNGMRGEINQLRSRIQMAEAERDAANSLAKRRHDEIERLRLENDGLKLAVKMRPKPELVDDPRQQAIIAEQKAEIERLREHHRIAVDNWTLEAQTVKQQEDEIHALKAEIGRLRNALAQSCDDQRQLAREELNFPCEAAMDNEVLRGLLREMLDGYCADNLTQQDVENRVREALGEKS